MEIHVINGQVVIERLGRFYVQTDRVEVNDIRIGEISMYGRIWINVNVNRQEILYKRNQSIIDGYNYTLSMSFSLLLYLLK